MDAKDADVARAIVSAYDWGVLGHVVDVGGGDGALLAALLAEYPTLSGTVVDLPETAETARRNLAAAGLGDRARVVAADFFSALPVEAEGYLLSSVLSCWGDDEACALLHNCASAAGEDGAVFVIEKHPVGEAAVRDVPELTALAERAGLTVSAVHTADDVTILELAV